MKGKSIQDQLGRVSKSKHSSSHHQSLQQRSLQEKHKEILKSMLDSNIMKPTNVEA